MVIQTLSPHHGFRMRRWCHQYALYVGKRQQRQIFMMIRQHTLYPQIPPACKSLHTHPLDITPYIPQKSDVEGAEEPEYWVASQYGIPKIPANGRAYTAGAAVASTTTPPSCMKSLIRVITSGRRQDLSDSANPRKSSSPQFSAAILNIRRFTSECGIRRHFLSNTSRHNPKERNESIIMTRDVPTIPQKRQRIDPH